MTKVSFCGISGSGMSALAQILKARGIDVRGSDRNFDQGKDSQNRAALEQVGIKIFPQDGSAIEPDLDCVYASTGVEDHIADIQKAAALNIPILKRSDLLADIFASYENGIAVGGTSGKTTVTAMIGYILDTLNKKPTVINGGLLNNYQNRPGIPNIILNDGKICVIEADESDGSIEKYRPYIALVNNIGMDHKPIEELQKLFEDFVAKATFGAVVNLDCGNSSVLRNIHPRTVTFSICDPQADFYASDIVPLADGVEYKFGGSKFKLRLPGAFNVMNALAAIAACSLAGVDPKEAAEALKNFLGTKRRLEVIGVKNNITVIDDFAHNPDKVKASMTALRDYPGRLLVMFQPHGFSPMRLMGRQIVESFAALMQEEDCLFIPEIYYAGGTVKRDISSLDLIEYARSLNVAATFCQTREEVKEKILQIARPGDRIVIMGARDNTLSDFCKEILKRIKS